MNINKPAIALSLSLGCAFSAHAVEYLFSYDNVLDGIDQKTNTAYININQQGEILHGTSPDGGVLTGEIEQKNNVFTGSGEMERFSFKLLENGAIKWFTGQVTNTGWKGVWYGPNGEQGDFSIGETDPSMALPTAADVVEFKADTTFSGARFDKHNPWNEDFLVPLHDVGSIPFAGVDQSKGVFVQSDSGGLPFPMSFELGFSNSFTLQTFRLGSFNNGQGTRLKTFNLDVWENGQWVTKGSFEFPVIAANRTFEMHEFMLDQKVTANRVRISATGTRDMYHGGRVLMWGLSFH
ncbi:hypothetical protein N474_19375 [Pseudoalteromonas luteoviolacea CPMOR-2]|uniref:hypothetical protein n=1 Tax=Pseudoalteromonas luteoviolacea TaxID=43657 RepID=UPI0007B039E2|nr:hypothetical protein [Pseudoalteromonas luteoviolacea]KZN53734.1 hypothetical protein N474_19375 [Pseudoalteromonas luteoviolacea CPMOR-2]